MNTQLNTELISGMTEITDYIKKLEEENKVLKQKLSEVLQEQQEDHEVYKKTIDRQCKEIHAFKNLINQQREEINCLQDITDASVANKAIDDLNGVIMNLQEKFQTAEKESNVKSDTILCLFDKIMNTADIDDGVSIPKEFGHKYIDEWNFEFDKLMKKVVEDYNESQYDDDEYLWVYHNHDNISYDEKEKEESEDEE
tara:strand:- start:57 stop:650 length:594 start_codon:yes stop_codon:yes gene_type:complete